MPSVCPRITTVFAIQAHPGDIFIRKFKLSIHILTSSWCCNWQHRSQIIHPTVNFISMNCSKFLALEHWHDYFWPLSFFLFHPHENQSKFLGYQGWVKFWWLPWFPAQNNTCVNISNTVYEGRLEVFGYGGQSIATLHVHPCHNM